jgi:hypothetical protein
MNNEPPALYSTNLTASVSSDTFTLSWPVDHLGWRLQAQTNGLGGGWLDVPGSSATNLMAWPVDGSTSSVFFRLIYP